jgi:ribosome-associated protein
MANTPAKKIAKKAVAKKSTAPKKVAAPKAAAPKKVAAKKVAAKKTTAPKVVSAKVATKKVGAAKTAAPKKAVELKKMEPGLLLAYTVAQGMYERKAENIRIMDMRKIHSASADYFVVCHADNDKKVEAIAKSAEEEVKKRLNENPLHREGFENLEWILLDYFNVVAHIFLDEKRTFYGIEQLWGDAENIEFKGK